MNELKKERIKDKIHFINVILCSEITLILTDIVKLFINFYCHKSYVIWILVLFLISLVSCICWYYRKYLIVNQILFKQQCNLKIQRAQLNKFKLNVKNLKSNNNGLKQDRKNIIKDKHTLLQQNLKLYNRCQKQNNFIYMLELMIPKDSEKVKHVFEEISSNKNN